MARDHQLFVGRNHPGRHAACRAADARRIASVRARVEFDAQPGRIATDPFAERSAVLPDPGREDDRVESAKRRGEGAKLAANPQT
jgi:hypothetical protein